ncbi:MAG: 50S ribosomal protein L2 [Candidatus Liptonbacteria bacterium]|nr:50S ribosomal protein L2 [Candidatus Liptonbacteria bacterium]
MKSYKPTSPGIRGTVVVDYSKLSKEAPFKPLLKKLKDRAGRNNDGRITTRHQGGGNKKMYRSVDFREPFLNVPAKVETIEYDPYRTTFIARVVYKNGARSYILAPEGMKVGDSFIVAEKAELKPGNRMRLKNIPVGYQVHNVEIQPGKGGALARSAGSYATILAQEDGHTHLQMPSKEVRKISWESFASLGQLSNPEHNLITIGKAGRSRWLGIRPTVRGTAMNPVDHPYGGGEGRQPRGTRKPKTLWGKVTGGRKTRKKHKWSNKLIVKRRK